MGDKQQLHGKGALEKCPICGSKSLEQDQGEVEKDGTLPVLVKCRRCENFFGETWKTFEWEFIVDDEEPEARA